MKALVLLSHGSRRGESNDEIKALAEEIQSLPDNPFESVECAFQQFAAPTFKETIEHLSGRGVVEIVVFPLFLASGHHVRVDVPEMIGQARKWYPRLKIRVMTHLGKTPGMARFLMDEANRGAAPGAVDPA